MTKHKKSCNINKVNFNDLCVFCNCGYDNYD